jgi:hypothetical protein
MNPNRPFITEFYVGKHTEGDIYRELTPAEIIGSAVGSGAFGYHVYGYLGLDDGGVMHKLPKEFHDSIRVGNDWAKQAIPLLTPSRIKQIAILFQSQMAVMENYMVEGNTMRRMDSLGWYQLCSDAGFMVDVIHEDQIQDGVLSDYAVLIVPENDCYAIEPNPKAQAQVKAFAENGGIVFTGATHPYAAELFEMGATPHPKQCIRIKDGLILNDDQFYALTNLEPLAVYEDSHMTAIGVKSIGKGKVYGFGFMAGAQYVAPRSDSVPPKYGNKAYYPINLVQDDPMRELLKKELSSVLGQYTKDGSLPQLRKNICFSAFQNGVVVVNHSSYPYDLSAFAGKKLCQYPAGEMLLPHSAAVILSEEKQ